MKPFLLSLIAVFALSAVASAADLCNQAPPGTNNWWCDQTFTISAASTIQSNKTSMATPRQSLKFQNNSDVNASSAGCVVCFGAAARGVACSTANGGTYLRAGQSLYLSNQGWYGASQINSIYFNSDISAVNVGGTCTLGVTIDG